MAFRGYGSHTRNVQKQDYPHCDAFCSRWCRRSENRESFPSSRTSDKDEINTVSKAVTYPLRAINSDSQPIEARDAINVACANVLLSILDIPKLDVSTRIVFSVGSKFKID